VNRLVTVFEVLKAREMSIVTAVLLEIIMRRLEWVAGLRFKAKIFST
jgi:hypothetical protein